MDKVLTAPSIEEITLGTKIDKAKGAVEKANQTLVKYRDILAAVETKAGVQVLDGDGFDETVSRVATARSAVLAAEGRVAEAQADVDALVEKKKKARVENLQREAKRLEKLQAQQLEELEAFQKGQRERDGYLLYDATVKKSKAAAGLKMQAAEVAMERPAERPVIAPAKSRAEKEEILRNLPQSTVESDRMAGEVRLEPVEGLAPGRKVAKAA